MSDLEDGKTMLEAAVIAAKHMSEKDKIKSLLSLCIPRFQQLAEEGTGISKSSHPFEFTMMMGLLTFARALDLMTKEEMDKVLGLDGNLDESEGQTIN